MDPYWGVGFDGKGSEVVKQMHEWKVITMAPWNAQMLYDAGSNVLGELLMRLRDELDAAWRVLVGVFGVFWFSGLS